MCEMISVLKHFAYIAVKSKTQKPVILVGIWELPLKDRD